MQLLLAARGRALAAILCGVFAGCAMPAEVVPYAPPAAGPSAQFAVKTEKMWAPNRVTLFLVQAGQGGGTGVARLVGQLQSGEKVKREVLSFESTLPANVPLSLLFEYRYDAGSLLETGCDFPVTLTLAAGGRYLVDFIKDPHGCLPRFFVLDKSGAPSEIAVIRK